MNGRVSVSAVLAAVVTLGVASAAQASTERQHYVADRACCQVISGTTDVRVVALQAPIEAIYRVRFGVHALAPPGASLLCHSGAVTATSMGGPRFQVLGVGYIRISGASTGLALACRFSNAFATGRIVHASLELTRVNSVTERTQ